MAHFYGSVQGSRGEVHRLAGKTNIMTTIAASYQGGVQVDLRHKDGVDYATVSLIRWKGHGVSRVVYDGPVNELESGARESAGAA